MSQVKDRHGVSVVEVSSKLPLDLWKGLYAAAARTDSIPVVILNLVTQGTKARRLLVIDLAYVLSGEEKS